MDDATKPLLDDQEFLTDFARLADGIYDERFLRTKYHFVDDATWERLGQDDELVEKIMLLRASCVRSGATKRELAQKYIIRGPQVLAGIMDDPNANARHRVDSIKALDDLADNGPASAPTSDERFIIRIDLTAGGNKEDVIVIDKSVKPDAGKTIDHSNDDTAPQGLLPLFAATKRRDDGGQPI